MSSDAASEQNAPPSVAESLAWTSPLGSSMPLRAVAAALKQALNSSSAAPDAAKGGSPPVQQPAKRPLVGKPVTVEEFPHFARLVAVAAYLAWIQINGAEFLPEREYRFAKDIAKQGLLSDDEIVADLATHGLLRHVVVPEVPSSSEPAEEDEDGGLPSLQRVSSSSG
mmetsp:Transcript_25710/g.102606  ORF Transcript_25710/g.102606 Transcript_25710/m.102606 type:complete len:168 (-) Transcript_25710:1325-1828(-)